MTGPRWRSAVTGSALALVMFSVAPVRAGRSDREATAVAVAVAPLVGALIGLAVGLVAAALGALGAPPLLAGVLAAGTAAVLTRGMHLDGLADLADGLGCYGPPERMLAVMRDPATGAFGVITLVVALGTQAAALGAVATGSVSVVGVVVALALGRAAFAWSARRGVPAASPDGLGALVAGTQPRWVAPAWLAVLVAGSPLAAPGRWWQGPVAVLVGAGVVVALAAHARRRLDGVSGDVFGATCEAGATACLAVLAL